MAVKKKTTVKKKTAAKKKASGAAGSRTRKKTMGKKSAGKKKSTGGQRPNVTVVSDTGGSASLPWSAELSVLAMRWRYIFSRRSSWIGGSRDTKRAEALKAVTKLIPLSEIKPVLSDAQLIEVQVPYRNEKSGWEGRIAPWEFLISATASGIGNRNPLTIVRRLKTRNEVAPVADEHKVLYVQCEPGKLSGWFDFTTERGSLERQAIEGNGEFRACINPTLRELGDAIIEFEPSVIHLAGIDNNQAKELLAEDGALPDEWLESKVKDGIALASDDPDSEVSLELIDAETLAGVLNTGPAPVNLVTANVYHSASRICALAVAEGAGLAIGFQDTISDALAEVILREFYKGWFGRHDALPSFVGALNEARSTGKLSGAGIVLWSARSLVKGSSERIEEVRKSREEVRETVLSLESDDYYSKWLSVDISVHDRLNYSLLHNDSGGMFETFVFRKDKEGLLKDVCVEVVLYLGSESFAYRSRLTLKDYRTGIEGQIKVPLTSSIIRTVSEPMRTCLYVQVTVADKVVHQETYQVTLLPVDEWKDTDTDRVWLPSFVLPRDPAVASIIGRAHNHLITLADDRNIGFNGYQSFDSGDAESLNKVDLQAQAIWATIVGDFGIRYINPPPSYSPRGQRLRTPTQIVNGGSGTCIDLALLFAACLEYIDVYSVIFLFGGHAFAGYWRSEDRWYDYLDVSEKDVDDARIRQTNNQVNDMYELGSTEGLSPWIVPHYEEIFKEVTEGFLVPIETTGITIHGSFRKATAEGKKRLGVRNAFDSMIDIPLARKQFITPLPIID